MTNRQKLHELLSRQAYIRQELQFWKQNKNPYSNRDLTIFFIESDIKLHEQEIQYLLHLPTYALDTTYLRYRADNIRTLKEFG